MSPLHQKSKWSFVLRCMLLVIVGWPGPRPYLHDHQHFGSGGLASAGLQQHLIQYHSHDAGGVVDSELLHFHWLIIPPQAGEPGQNSCVNCCSISEFRSDAASNIDLLNFQQVVYLAPLDFVRELRVEHAGAHSSSPHQSVRLQQMYCSMNC